MKGQDPIRGGRAGRLMGAILLDRRRRLWIKLCIP